MCCDTQGCKSIGHRENVSEAIVNGLFFSLLPQEEGLLAVG